MRSTPLRRARALLPHALLPVALLAALARPVEARQAQAAEIPSLEEKTRGMQAIEGFFDLYWDDGAGKLFWELPVGAEFLYQVSMGSGLGSNPIGIDRGQLGDTHLLEATRVGPRLLLMEPNHRFRARSDNPVEVEAVRDAFAPSVLWGFDIAARADDRVLVDATDFFLRDARDVVGQIQRANQGRFQLDRSRSAIHLPATKSFPENTEVEAILTFTSDSPGGLVRGVAVAPGAVTLRQHHSFIMLPDDGYRTRVADPRVGVNGPTIFDYATPIDEDLRVRWVARHRLQKADPDAERSRAIEPIVYYVDPGTPEPIRSALIEGASWWNRAFEAAGFVDAFQVRVLPEGVDPQDIRYNIIHWTHRRTRGYSYGNTVADPRTGEIIRGVVNLGSLRLRQDYLHGQGMVPPFGGGIMSSDGGGWLDDPAGSGGPYWEACQLAGGPDFEYLAQVAGGSEAVELALARVRQLSAHEVGHTLGFPHNYLASSYGRESVMDYPAPLVEIGGDGSLDLSNAYLQRIGRYDELAVEWLYRQFPDGTDESQALAEIARRSVEESLVYMGHMNNNFIGAGHPYASVWDNGADLVDHLKLELRVRQIGLERFGPEVIRPGEPLSTLELVLLPLYMHHRFQLRSAAQTLGGADYRYALRGDGQVPLTIVPAVRQRDALETILSTLTVDFLALPERIVSMIPPPAYRYDDGEEFPGHTELLFDPLGAAEAAAAFSVGEILHPQRMARLVVYGSLGDYPDLEEVTDRLVQATWDAAAPADEYRRRVLHVIQRAVVDRMMQQASMEGNPAEVRAVLSDRLDRLADRIEAQAQPTPHAKLVAADIRRWEERIENTVPGPMLQMPAGDPIGGSGR
ncbi:MAG TPA: zinc-dependent metalloprotease [Longimicrobiales bacterium]|nr:zinc-dependent metalloprotease [Longimicrobiales bacterium]